MELDKLFFCFWFFYSSIPTHGFKSFKISNVAVQKSSTLQMQTNYVSLQDITVLRTNGQQVKVKNIIPQNKPILVCFLTHFADFNSWELTQRVRHDLANLQGLGIEVSCIGIGSPASAKKFCELLDFPEEKIYSDPSANSHKSLGFSRGPFPNIPIPPLVKLGLMLVGIGSPGTIQAVLGGYFGSKSRINDGGVGNWIDSAIKQGASKGRFPTKALGKDLSETGSAAWDSLGTTGLRPFELATLRLQNMIGGILNNWKELAPSDPELVIQQGGCVLLDKNKATLYRYDDKGILTYTPLEEVIEVLKSVKQKETKKNFSFKIF